MKRTSDKRNPRLTRRRRMLRALAVKLALVAPAALIPAPCGSARAAISLNAIDVASTQNFDSLISSGSATWVNDSTIPGWYHARTGTGTTIVAGTGSSTTGALYSFGVAGMNPVADRALGSVGSGNAAAGDFFWGAQFQNNTGQTVEEVDIEYYGEQWRSGGTTSGVQTVEFFYRIGGATFDANNTGWTSAGALDFSSVVNNAAAGALDGNLGSNRVLTAATIGSLSIPDGGTLWVRWYDPDHASSDHGLAIDDFSITPRAMMSPPVYDYTLEVVGQKTNIDFTGFNGAGFEATPGGGQLDSDVFAVTGLSDGAGTFGGTHNTGDFARGSSAGGETTGGIYAFDVGGGNIALGMQPAGSDMTPGEIMVRLLNDTGQMIDSVDVMYDIFFLNNEDRANSLNFAYSTDGMNFTPLMALDFTSPEGSDAIGWLSENRAVTLSDLAIAPGGFLYLSFVTDDVSGAGSRDEIAIDNIMVQQHQIPEPASATLLGFAAAGLLTWRRRRAR